MQLPVRRFFGLTFALLLVLGLAPTLTQARSTFPDTIALPNGWLPEGIVVGRGPVIYSGSRATGQIYAADLRTGQGAILTEAVPGRMAVGLSFDQRSNYIYVAGGNTGDAYVYDAATGASVAVFELTDLAAPFINDVIVTRDAAYFTNSSAAEIYRVAIGPGGRIDQSADVTTIPLSGEWQQVAGFNANGIEATPNGDALIIVNSTVGALYKVDPASGAATLIDLGGASVSAGDGILLEGHTLYVVRNRLNQVAVVDLAPDLLSGSVADAITSPAFDVPTTIDRFGNSLYLVNARFSTPPTPDTPYTIVRVDR
ncbi:MAG TPA: hypothetical protein VFT99_05980 [Roseiflexaceae bacterium]|nr:hypothetical protein [Roseiflexaceae bacterium]